MILAKKSENQTEIFISVTPKQVQSVFKCIGNFLNFMFRKTHYEWVVAEVSSFGTFLRNSNTKRSEFIPSHQMQLETGLSRAMPNRLQEPCQRQELLLNKIASITQLSENTVHQILILTGRAIGHYLKTDKRPVSLDFGLSTNEVLLFENESIQLIEKQLLRDQTNMQGTDSRNAQTLQSSLKKRMFGNSLRAAIAIGKLTADALSSYSPKSKGSKFSTAGKDDQRSIRSNTRSLTISIASKPFSNKEKTVSRSTAKVDFIRNSVNDTPSGLREVKTPNAGISGRKHNALMQFLQPRASIQSN